MSDNSGIQISKTWLTIILALVTYAIAGIWWGATLDNRMVSLENERDKYLEISSSFPLFQQSLDGLTKSFTEFKLKLETVRTDPYTGSDARQDWDRFQGRLDDNMREINDALDKLTQSDMNRNFEIKSQQLEIKELQKKIQEFTSSN